MNDIFVVQVGIEIPWIILFLHNFVASFCRKIFLLYLENMFFIHLWKFRDCVLLQNFSLPNFAWIWNFFFMQICCLNKTLKNTVLLKSLKKNWIFFFKEMHLIPGLEGPEPEVDWRPRWWKSWCLCRHQYEGGNCPLKNINL